MATRMQQRRGTAAQWESADPILAAGEIGFESDTGQFKIGDGVNHWADLSYFKNLEDLGGSLDDYILVSTKGQANGVAELDATGKVPTSQLPDLAALDEEITTAVTNAINDLVGTAPASLNTLGELADALNDDANFSSTVVGLIADNTTALGDHNSATSGVHGVIGAVVGEENTQTLKNKTIDGQQNTFTNIQQADVIDLATDLASKAPITSPGFLGNVDFSTATTVTGLTKTTVGLGEVDNTADADKPVSTATQSALDTKQDKVADVSDVEIGYLNGVTSAIQTQLDAKASTTDLSDHASDTTSVHGIDDTSKLVTTDGAQVLYNKTLSSPTISLAGTTLGVATTLFLNTFTEGTLADWTSGSGTGGNVIVVSGTSSSDGEYPLVGTVQSDGSFTSASALPMELNGYPLGTTFTVKTLTTISSTEISYLDGVTSTIQTQLDAKAGLTSPNFDEHILVDGNVKLSSTSEIWLSDGSASSPSSGSILIKRSSNSGKVAINANGADNDIAVVSNPDFTGTLSAENVEISGNLTVSGTTTTVSTQDLVVSDPMIYMGDSNAANLVDLGIVSSFNDGTYQHTGLVRDASESKWKLFKGVTDEPTTVVNFGQGSLDDLAINNLEAYDVTANTLYYGGITGATSVQAEIEKKTPELYTFITESGTSKTIATADQFDSLKFTSSSAVTVTVPTNASDAIPVGTYVELYQWGDGQLTVTAATPATTAIRSTDSQNKSRTKYSSMLLIKVDTDEWLLTGDLTA